MTENKSIRLLTMKQVLRATGFKSRTTVYNQVNKDCFPKPCSLGLGRIR